MKPRVVIAVATLVVALVGCTLLTPLDDLSGGAPLATSDAGDAIADVVAAGDERVVEAGPDAPPSPPPCPTPPCLITVVQGGRPGGITVDATHVYWIDTDLSALLRAPKYGGPKERLDQAGDALVAPFDVAVDGTYVYWSERGDRVWRKPLAGGAKQLAVPGAGGSSAYIALNGSTIYITDYQTTKPTLGSVVVAGSVPATVLYANQPLAAGIANTPDDLVWGLKGAIAAGTRDGGTPSSLASGLGAISGVAADRDAVYWIEDEKRIVRQGRRNPSRATVHEAESAFGAGDMAIDAESVYFSEPSNGAIRRLTR